jgi:hypothetical protein
MDRKTRDELNQLSKQVFGTSSRWQKIVNNGVAEPMSRERDVIVPTSKGLKTKTYTDKKTVVRHYSVDEVKKLMEDILEERKKRVVAKIETGGIDDMGVEFKTDDTK